MNKLKNSGNSYVPSEKILKKYADVLVKFALGSGKGIKKGEVVYLAVPEIAKPILIHLQAAVLEAGGHFITEFIPDNVTRNFYEKANQDQLTFLPKNYLLERIKVCDHFLRIDGEKDKHELSSIPSSKIMTRQKMMKFYKEARDKKENEGKLTWTIGTYGTEAMAKEAKMTLEEYWEQIIKACFLNAANPIKKWQEVFEKTEKIKKKIDKLLIDKVHIKGEDVDLEIKIGESRKWLGGSGRNI
ncbi:aminopeptidase, partial [Candidatus Gracilibacteria bacterium]|nr:aminopeptidase [Candidatus Gracilibacteria bacterium]